MLDTAIVKSVAPSDRKRSAIAREFRALVDEGVQLRVDGSARDDPTSLLSLGYTPKFKFELFDALFYLTPQREDLNFRFFVAWVGIRPGSGMRPRAFHPRIFYKDQSLVWRSATHYIHSEDENWVGKGDLKTATIDGEEQVFSAEETTNLPLEMQDALDVLSRWSGGVRRDHRALGLILHNAPDDRLEPYRDFTGPRRKAASDPRNRIHGGKCVARFAKEGDPHSLRFVRGFAPDFDDGVIETCHLKSRMYGGEVRKLRILSENRRIQYQFVAAPRQVWIIPPQTLHTQLMTYGVRTIDVHTDEDLCVPGYEYHFVDEHQDPPRLYTQIPSGYAGAASEIDPSRADASPWIEELPVIQEFRRKLGIRRG